MTSGLSSVAQPELTMAPVGKTSTSCENLSQARKAFPGGRSPVGRKVLAATTRAKRSGCSPTSRRPMRPPQSWPTKVTSDRARVSKRRDRIHSTCRAKVYAERGVGLSDRPKPTRSGAMARNPAPASTGIMWRYR